MTVSTIINIFRPKNYRYCTNRQCPSQFFDIFLQLIQGLFFLRLYNINQLFESVFDLLRHGLFVCIEDC